jgi:hypothetical protein
VTAETGILAILDALGLPPEARVDARVPKKLLVEQGAPTSADKRAIQEGIDELQWLAACKPTTIGVPVYADQAREYLEIAVIACAFRPEAKAGRLIQLIHRAIPYPVVLITTDANGVTVSVAHKRKAQNEAGKVVVERVVSVGGLRADRPSDLEQAFMDNLALACQPRRDLFTLYEGWLVRIEALNAARLAGLYAPSDDAILTARRRAALDAHSQLTREIIGLRAKASHEKQLNRRVHYNLEIQRMETDLATHKRNL